jgi:GMP reductase
MRIESDVKLDFSDVLLKPKRSTIESRKDIDLTRTFKFRYGIGEWTGVPIISSNMSSVTTPAVAEILDKHKMLACIPKNREMDFSENVNAFPSIGLGALKAISYQFSWVALDVPNGYMEQVVDQTKTMREAFPYMTIIVGNVVSAEATEALIIAGADIVKVGIGSGAACSTRIKTGVGMPQLSAVIECADAAHGLGGHIISDGGCGVPGDIVKAFAGGADFVMLGGMLAGHDENGPDFYGSSSERGNNETAGGLKNYRASEGWEIKLPARGPLENTLQDIEGGMRSACAYVGAKTLKALPKCTTFVQVNRQANTSLWGDRV